MAKSVVDFIYCTSFCMCFSDEIQPNNAQKPVYRSIIRPPDMDMLEGLKLYWSRHWFYRTTGLHGPCYAWQFSRCSCLRRVDCNGRRSWSRPWPKHLQMWTYLTSWVCCHCSLVSSVRFQCQMQNCWVLHYFLVLFLTQQSQRGHRLWRPCQSSCQASSLAPINSQDALILLRISFSAPRVQHALLSVSRQLCTCEIW